MANRAKAKGTSWETAIVRWLTARGLHAQRIVLHGNQDQGDIEVTGRWTPVAGQERWNLEAKNVRTLALSQWVAEAEKESANSGRPVAVVAKKVGTTDVGQSYVIMPMHMFAEHVLGAMFAEHVLGATIDSEED